MTLLAAAFLFTYALPWGTAANEPFIDTAAPIRPVQCAPCHLDISDVDVDGLIFNHGNHLLVTCEGCHYRMPHRGDITERVPMEACFACHGVSHGVQGELATGKCEDCHTRPDELRPDSHGLTWAKEPHAEVSRESGVNPCMMCHDAIWDCDACHATKAPDVPLMPLGYHSMVTPLDKGPSVRIYTRGPVSMSQCSYCHAGIDDTSGERLIFAHADHIERSYRCEACHPRFPHTAVGLERPDMMSCYRCHGLNHNSHGQVATEKCEACHPVSFELMPDDHTRAFIKGEHKDPAEEDPATCAMCHKSEFCAGCHRGKKVSPNAPGRQVIPANHREVEWQKDHGTLFLGAVGSCNSCHDDASCKRCHQTVMPHPVGWMENHTPEPGVSGEDCNVCHTNRATCQDCHHQSVKGENLLARNCTPCHEEMKTDPPTDITHKMFAEHAVHFEARTLDGRPYRCDDCHYGFGRTHVPMPGTSQLPEATHELRLCYSCHGALDFRNRLIAPYRGRELCTRCHTDLRV